MACGCCVMDVFGGLIEMVYNLLVIYYGVVVESKDVIQCCFIGVIIWWNVDGQVEKGKDVKKIIWKGVWEVGVS